MVLVKNIRVFKKRLQIAQKKWSTIQGQSLRTVNLILSILSRLNLTQRTDIFSKDFLTKFEDVQSRLAFKLTESINNHLLELSTYITQFQEVIHEMRKIEQQFRCDILSLIKKQAVKSKDQWPHDLDVIDQAEKTIQQIIDMYETELALRKQIVAEIQQSMPLQPHVVNAFLILWISDVYIETARIQDLIEEFGFVEKIYNRSVEQGSILKQ